jgi:hypothetical protein
VQISGRSRETSSLGYRNKISEAPFVHPVIVGTKAPVFKQMWSLAPEFPECLRVGALLGSIL